MAGVGAIGRIGRIGTPGVSKAAEYLTINGILARLLVGADGQALRGQDGQYQYGKA